MEQFIPADWRINMGDAFAPSSGEDDGHVVMHNQPPWFHYPVVHDPLEMDLFSEILGEMRATVDAGRVAGSDTAGYGTPTEAIGAASYHGASTTVTLSSSSSTRLRAPGGGKRKKSDTTECPSEVMMKVQDAEEESYSAAADAVTTHGPAQRPTTGKRRRAAQEHNLSERRRRDRINEKMRALQELVPHCNKVTDKASMLDETIHYLKSLQLQVQLMWTTGGGMASSPVMFPASGAHRYMQRVASMRSRMPPFWTCAYTSSNDTKLS